MGNGLANGRKFSENSTDNYSVAFIYTNRLPTDTQQEGMIPEEALSQLIKCGTVKESEWITPKKYSTLKPLFETDKNTLLPLAYPNRVSSYYELKKYEFEDIKLALNYGFEVYVSVDIYFSFHKAVNGMIPDADKINEYSYGAHFMRVVGYDKFGRMKCVNSWGDTWGDNGYCWIPFSSNIINKLYAVADNITEQSIKELKFKIIYNTLIYTNFDDAFSVATNLSGKVWYSEGKYYIQYGNDFNTRPEAVSYKNTINEKLKDKLSIIPVTSQYEYVLYYEGFPNSMSLFESLINTKFFGNYNYFIYTKNNIKYIGMKFNTLEECVEAKNSIKRFDLSLWKIDTIEVM